MENKNNHLLQRLLSLGLIFVLLLSLAGCFGQPDTKGTVPSKNLAAATPAATTQGTTAVPTELPTTVSTEPPTTAPTEPETQPTEPPATEPEPLVYTLTQEDVDEFYRLLSECETLAITGEDMDAIDAASAALDAQYAYLDAQNSIAMVLYYSDMADESLTQQHLDCVDICTAASDAYIQSTRRVYLSDSPLKEQLFEGWTQEEINQLLGYDERISQLQQRNAEIAVAYRAATEDSVRISLYIEFVQNNNETARLYGYDTYYDYAYALVYGRDYGPEALAQMRGYAKEYLADIYDTAVWNFINSFYGLSESKQNSVAAFLYNDYSSMAKNYVDMYLSAVPESMGNTMRTMLTADSLFATAPGAMAGAFTTAIGERSYCFFGPGYTNSCTIIHEAGHYYASRHTDLDSIPLDLAETHSQCNEWLFIRYLEKYMAADQYDALVDYRMYNDLAMILICLMVDEFEQQVYSADLTNFTAEDLDAIMDGVVSQYFSLDYAADYLTDLNNYWRMVVVEQPVYYISYAASSIAAIDLYTVAVEDFDSAVAIYQKLCEQPLMEDGFQANITAAGLAGPFKEEFYQELCEIIKNRA